jgi:alpha-ketoglutarate-dependent 2,4-dichlorophenoxyacetate dioxygenase
MLSAVTVPALGGDTEFADLRMAYDALPAWRKKQIEGLKAIHYALHSRFMLGDTNYTEEQKKAIPPAAWPLVQTDLRSGRDGIARRWARSPWGFAGL